MDRRRKIRKRKKIHFIFVLMLCLLAGMIAVLPWALKPENLGGLKDKIVEVFQGEQFKDSYNAKSLVLTDLSNDDNFIYKQAEEQQLPASLAKLYVIEYASTLVKLEDIVPVNSEALCFRKQEKFFHFLD